MFFNPKPNLDLFPEPEQRKKINMLGMVSKIRGTPKRFRPRNGLVDVGWSLMFVGKHSWIWGEGCPLHLEEAVSQAWKAEMAGRGVEVLVRGVEDQNAAFVRVFFRKFAGYLKGKPNNRLKLREKNRQLERIDVFPVEIFCILTFG